MAIFEIGGGAGGIAEYLETGKKYGRNYAREEMDKRLVLHGNLALTDTIIKSMDRDPDAERYIHWSFSFAEDHISEEMLRSIAQDCKEFFGAAYGDDELNQYAEAHIPKLKEIQSEKGDLDKRFVHIHGVIPTINLKSGKRANPLELLSNKFGSKTATWEYINAFQEHLNAKYGLKSPKDAIGIGNGKAEAIGRHKEADQDLKKGFLHLTMRMPEIILDRMLAEDIRNVDDFKKMISTYGSVSTGTKRGLPEPYFKITLPGQTKAIRLDDKWFQPSFIQKDIQEKRELLKSSPEYLEAGAPREPDQSNEDLLKEWHEQRAHEIRYIRSSNKWARETYFKLDKEEKLAILASMRRGEKAPAAMQQEEGNLVDIPSERLNKFRMRTLDEIQAAEEFGKQIIGNEDGAADQVIKTLTQNESVITMDKIESYLLAHTAGMEQYDEALASVLASPELVVLESDKGERLYTSETVLRIEDQMMNDVRASQNKEEGTPLDSSGVDVKTMNPGQKNGFNALCSGKPIVYMKGPAGSGKSFVLARMNQAAVASGFEVWGTILQGKTAEDFERDSGIKSSTIHSFLSRVESGEIKLHEKSMIVVDEAGMVGSELMKKLVSLCNKSGARLRLVGDTYQIQSVSYGSALDKIAAVVGETALTQIMRQKEEWQQEASVAFSRHDIETGLRAYHDKGNVHFHGDQIEAIDALVAKVREDRNNPEMAGQSQIVICKTNADRRDINYLIRQDLIDEGRVGKESVLQATGENSKIAIAAGDRMMFLATDRNLGVRNGTTGTVKEIRDGTTYMEINGREISFDQNYDVKMDYAFCVTINKSQGVTEDRGYVLASKNMTANDLYVAETRHKLSVETFAGQDQLKNIDDMCNKLSRASEKTFSIDERELGKANTMVEQLLQDHKSEALIARESKRTSMEELRSMDPQRVLDTCAAKYGLQTDLYSITEEGKIRCGSRELDNVAFLTREMNLDYRTEAVPALREMHSQMLKGIYVEPPTKPTQAQIHDFTAWRKAHEAEYKRKLTNLNNSGRVEKKLAASKGGKARVIDIQDRLVKERAALKAEYVKPQRALFQQYRKEQMKEEVAAQPAVQPTKGKQHEQPEREHQQENSSLRREQLGAAGLSINKPTVAAPLRRREETPPPPDRVRGEVRELQSMRKMDGVSQHGEVLLQDGVHAQLGNRPSDAGSGLRRSGGGGGLKDLQSLKPLQQKPTEPKRVSGILCKRDFSTAGASVPRTGW